MKNFLIILIFILWFSYYFIPYDTKIDLLNKVWIKGSFLPEEDIVADFSKEKIVSLKFDSFKKETFKWNISNWEVMKDLSWASDWFTKCFYSKDYNQFNWNIVLHRVLLLKNKNIKVKLIPDTLDSKLSMYIYKTDAISKIFPPEKEYVHDCKIDVTYDWDRELEMKWNTAPSDIVIWITWAEGVLEWWYTLELEEI